MKQHNDHISLFQKRYEQIGGTLKQINLDRCIRVNTKKISPEKLQQRLKKRGVSLEKIPFTQRGFRVKNERFNLVSSPEYLLGLFYIQEAAAQFPVEVLQPKGLVLDACAAPGGKTTQLALYADVIAVDNNKERFQKLRYNIERLGIDNCIAYQINFLNVRKTFDYILLDAPCSGNYMLEDGWIQKNTLQRIEERTVIQKQLLSHAISLLNPGGVLVYSTCSLEPEEDELVVQHALDHFSVKLEKIPVIGDNGLTSVFGHDLNPTMKYCRRFWPYKMNTIGFFVGRIRKC
jgi:tRNA (cytosine40_48-C5)-methyltransferase